MTLLETSKANKCIESKFVAAFREDGPAARVTEWFRAEYNLPYERPDGNTKKMIEQLDEYERIEHERLIPELAATEYKQFAKEWREEDFENMMEEINLNLENFQSDDGRIRYVSSLIQPFQRFAATFCAKKRVDNKKRQLSKVDDAILYYNSLPDDAVDENGKQINLKEKLDKCFDIQGEIQKDIDYLGDVELKFINYAQTGGGKPQEGINDKCKMHEYLGNWWFLMQDFARKLAAVALIHGIKLTDIQDRMEIYLKSDFEDYEYVDGKYITSYNMARKLLVEIDEKKSGEKAQEAECDGEVKGNGKTQLNPFCGFQFSKSIDDFTFNTVMQGFTTKLKEYKLIPENVDYKTMSKLFRGHSCRITYKWLGSHATLTSIIKKLMKVENPAIKPWPEGTTPWQVVSKRFVDGNGKPLPNIRTYKDAVKTKEMIEDIVGTITGFL